MVKISRLLPLALFFFSLVPVEILGVSCQSDDDRPYLRFVQHAAPCAVPEPLPAPGRIVAERADMDVFLGVDTLRSLLLFTGSGGRGVVAIRDMADEPTEMFNFGDWLSHYGFVHAVYPLPDGTWLIYEFLNNEPGRIWKFHPDGGGFRLVFTFRNAYQYIKKEWSFDYAPDTRTLYLAEYGNSPTNPIDPEDPEGRRHLGYKAGATRVWESRDMGETWGVLHDFSTDAGVYPERLHVHAVHYDAQCSRLYVTLGDAVDKHGNSNKRLCWTDNGVDWQHCDWQYYWGTSNNAWCHGQLVSLYAADGFIVAGGDDYNNCLYRIDKLDSPDGMELEMVCRYDASIAGSITQYAQRFVRLPGGLIACNLVGGDNGAFPRRARVLATRDGRTWYELFAGPLETSWADALRGEEVMRCWRGHLYFSCSQMVGGTARSVFYQMEVPQESAPADPPVPGPSAAVPAACPTTFPDAYGADGRHCAPGGSGVAIEGGRKVFRR